MKIYIFADMEGISGISGSEFVTPQGKFYQEARRYYTKDITTCAKACFKAGADEVLVRDGHGPGNHAIWEMIDCDLDLIQGRVPHGKRLPDIEGSDAIIFLGYHAMAGQADALLEHTYSSASIQNIWLNDRPVGEFAIDSAIAAEYDVPTIMVSGDDKLCSEASDFIPEVVTCQVKHGYTCQGARLLPPAKAHRLIEEKTLEAIAKIGTIPMPKVTCPARIRVELVERGQTRSGAGINVIDGRTVEATAESVEKAFYTTI